MTSTTGSRSRGRFVPTLTEVVTPVVLERDQVVAPVDPLAAAPEGLLDAQAVEPLRMGSALDAMVEAMLPQARGQLQAALQAAADALVAQQLQAMEEQLRSQLRATVRQAMGLRPRDGA
ncbi:MAG: hypothetical protein ACT4NV_13365 [Rhodoferax sp.]